MSLYVYVRMTHLMAASEWKNANKAGKYMLGQRKIGESAYFRSGWNWIIWAAALWLPMLMLPVVVQAQSAEDGFDPGANDDVLAVAVQPDGKILVGGSFTMLGGGGTGTTARSRIARLNPDGSLDTSFDPGANGYVNALAVQADGKILVGGSFTMLGGGGTGATTRNRIARLNPDGSLDTIFDPGANGEVHALTVQRDGKILVGGGFTTLGGGGTGTATRHHIGRLNPDGSLDANFDPGANDIVLAIEAQPDGKILAGGSFSMMGGGGAGITTRFHIARLNPDGNLDTAFNPGADNLIRTLAIQADGKILVGGDFSRLGGGGTGTTTRNCIGRLNPDGSLDTAFDPGANSGVTSVILQTDGKILAGGVFTTLGGGGTGTTTRNRIGRLNLDGSLDTNFNPGATGGVNTITMQPDGKILVGGAFNGLGGGTGTTTRNLMGRLNPDGSLDTTFDPGADGTVWALAMQPDGKILVGGLFGTLGGGGTGTAIRKNIGRLNPDGSLDTTFDPGTNNQVLTLAVQPDGKILVGGLFNTLGGGGTGTTKRNRIGRLNPDGSVDQSFDPGTNGSVSVLAVQPDGKILVGGNFTTLGGGGTGTTARNYIGRLNPDGSLDTSFNPGANSYIYHFGLQSDGKILVGGNFTMLGGGGIGTTARNYIGRLNPDGSLDTSFNPGANSYIYHFGLQSDGKILVGGNFTMLGGGGTGTTARNHVGRLNPDGSLDMSFDPGSNGTISSLAVEANGRILVGGGFTALGGGGTGTTTRRGIGRLNPDGSLDTNFDPGANNTVYALTVQRDGKILVGGVFTTLGGNGGTGSFGRSKIGRLTNDEAALENLTVNISSITWNRSGASPEIDRVTFELSTDGSTYTPLGSATRISGGWQMNGLSLPLGQNIYIRARGFYQSGLWGGSGSIVESVRTAFLAANLYSNDILWRNSSTGEMLVWLMNGVTRGDSGSLGSVPDLNWRIVGFADFNSDGKPDILWRNAATGDNGIWYMDGVTHAGGAMIDTVADQNWKIVGVGDFNNDGHVDILWRNVATGDNGVWYMDGVTHTGGAMIDTVADQNWKIVGVDDFNKDGHVDILWRNVAGDNAVWYMDGVTRVEGAMLQAVADQNWKIAGVADYNEDGHVDILWRNAVTGDNGVWYMNGVTCTGGASLERMADTDWLIFDVGEAAEIGADFDKNGTADLLWRNVVSGDISVWYMNGATVAGGASIGTVTDQNWKIAGLGDFNKDGHVDLLWRNVATGDNAVWYTDGVTRAGGAMLRAVTDQSWKIVGVADFNKDGKVDLLWWNVATGDNAVWYMDGVTQTGSAILPAVTDQNWRIVGLGDFNKDGKVDLLWRNVATGDNAVWYMDGVTQTGAAMLPAVADQNWKIVGVGDFSKDGHVDILWRNMSTGENYVWYMDGTTYAGWGSLQPVTDQAWQIMPKRQ